MSDSREPGRAGEPAGTRLTLDLWHPNCWAIEATDDDDGGVLAHAVYTAPETDAGTGDERVTGLFTAYGGSATEVDALLERIRASDLAGEVLGLRERFDANRTRAPGAVAREFFLEYDPGEMVCPTLLEHGFVHSAPVRIEGGRETWQVCYAGERDDVEDALDRVREGAGAEVAVEAVTDASTGRSERDRRLETLTPAQREAYEHAREAGYYRWPREASTRELADGLGVSKTTLLEHLRKAEAKLLGPEGP
ncbi:MAG: helix-turn-helix domain-containing protein [Haloarculaceae archaeon]